MASSAEMADGARPRARLVDELCRRLVGAAELDRQMRAALRNGDADAIDGATARLETLALESKLLAAEFGRAPAGDLDELRAARTRLDQTLTDLARSTAIDGALLARLIQINRRLIELIHGTEETYGPTGRAQEARVDGLRLRQRV